MVSKLLYGPSLYLNAVGVGGASKLKYSPSLHLAAVSSECRGAGGACELKYDPNLHLNAVETAKIWPFPSMFVGVVNSMARLRMYAG